MDTSAFLDGRPRPGISAEASEALAASAFAAFLRRLRRLPGARLLHLGALPPGGIDSVATRLLHRAESAVVINNLKLSSKRTPALWAGEASRSGSGGRGAVASKRRGGLAGRRFVPEGGEDSMFVPRRRRRASPRGGGAVLERLCERAAARQGALGGGDSGERDGVVA